MMEVVHEEWKDIEGYEGLYKISNTGKIFDCGSQKELKENTSGRYGNASIKKNGSWKYVSVHRLVAKAFIPNPNNSPIVNHKDLDKTNNHIDNLEWVTYGENACHYHKAKREGYKVKASNCSCVPVYFDSAKDIELIKKYAKSVGLSTSMWIRGLVFEKIKGNAGRL